MSLYEPWLEPPDDDYGCTNSSRCYHSQECACRIEGIQECTHPEACACISTEGTSCDHDTAADYTCQAEECHGVCGEPPDDEPEIDFDPEEWRLPRGSIFA